METEIRPGIDSTLLRFALEGGPLDELYDEQAFLNRVTGEVLFIYERDDETYLDPDNSEMDRVNRATMAENPEAYVKIESIGPRASDDEIDAESERISKQYALPLR